MAKRTPSGKFRRKVTIGYDPDGKPIYKYVTAPTRRELENVKEAVREHYIFGRAIPRDQPFYEYAGQWYRIKKEPFISNASRSYYKTCFVKHLLPQFGMQHMKAISAAQIQEFVNGFAGASKSQINNVIGTLKAIFASAYAEGVIERDPTVALIRPRASKGAGRRALTPEETRRVLETIRTHPEGLFLAILYYLGVRRGEALGLKFTDANNQLLSMPEILDILRGKFGETMDAAEKMELQKAFGDTEAVALIDLMYNKVGDLQDNIVNMYGSLGKGVSVTEQMASAIQETEPERFERLKQRIHNVTESIGNSLLPTVNDLMSKGEGVLTKVGSWIEKNQELVKVIMLIVLAVGGFLAVGGTLIALISGVGLVVTKTVSAFKILKGGFALARGALTPLISSVWSFTAALLANPVTWVVIGIVALIAALVLLYNKCEWFRNAVNSVINFFKETLTAVGSVAKSVFEGIGNVIGSVMDAAKATVSEKLSNIKTAYEEHGGGISGVAAAAMEAVKGWYTAGYTFIDNLTGGKLSEIRGKFSTAMSNIVQGISQKFTDARTAFSNGLNNIKNAVSGAVTWFFESGKRIVSTFANGIKSAFSSAVEAVKGGLQKIRNLLPFSDAKEGPLSTLTLSGQRTMTTYAHGLTLAGDAPAEAMNKSLQQVQGALDRKPEKKVDLGGGKKDKDESSDEGGSGKGKQVIIHKLLVPVDLKKIKDLQQLLALLQEVEDYAAANEDGEPGDDEDAVPAPA